MSYAPDYGLEEGLREMIRGLGMSARELIGLAFRSREWIPLKIHRDNPMHRIYFGSKYPLHKFLSLSITRIRDKRWGIDKNIYEDLKQKKHRKCEKGKVATVSATLTGQYLN